MLENAVKQRRQAHSLTQSELGEKVRVTRQTIAFIEKGDFSPSIALSLRLAAALSTPINELFWLTEEK